MPHPFRPARALVAVVLLSVAAAPSTQPATAPSHTPFVTVIMRDFPSWDRNHDGVLSTDEVDRAVRDPAVAGDDAAAAAAVKLLAQNKKLPVPLPPLTLAYFSDYDRQALALRRRRATTEPTGAAALAQTVDTVQSAAATRPAARSARLPADFDLYFAASRARIARGGPAPWTGRFVLDHTRQGPLGDCYFVAAVGAMVDRHPERLTDLVAPTPDGRYRVAFPTTRPVTLGKLSDAELAISSTTSGDGMWLALLEQGFGRGRALGRVGRDDVEGVDEIRNGGSITASIRLLTGHRAKQVVFRRTVESRRAVADQVLPMVRQELSSALSDGRLVLAAVAGPTTPTTQPTSRPGTTRPAALVALMAQAATRPATTRPVIVGTPVPVPPDISTKHAYAILAYDAKADTVTIWNPHGQQFRPKGTPGVANGYPTDHGRFTVPLTEAYQFLTSLAIEGTVTPTTAPATRPAVAVHSERSPATAPAR